jgi:biotin transporter BioY
MPKRAGAVWRVFVLSFGSLAILMLGVLHLSAFYTHDLGSALAVGLLPFLIGDGFKVLVASSILGSYRLLRRSQ